MTITRSSADVAAFYDSFAADYELAYGGAWESAVERQGAALERLIRRVLPDAADVLDCACGIGTQAIGLAQLGYRVRGTDLSAAAIDRARTEAARLGVSMPLEVADFRGLSALGETFDVVICCDNALPHLLTEAEVVIALSSMCERLRPGGLLVITMRDFDRAIDEKPPIAPPVVVAGPPRRILVRLHDWEPDRPVYELTYLVLTESERGWSVNQHETRYRAITGGELERAAESAGLDRIDWPKDVVVGGQRVTTLRRPMCGR